MSIQVYSRTFISSDGRTFEGELIRVKAKDVLIERAADREEFSIPISRFSEADKSYFERWARENPRLNLPGRHVNRISLRASSVRSNDETLIQETGRTLVNIDVSSSVHIDYDWITVETTVTATARAETERIRLKGATFHVKASSVSGPVHARIYTVFFVKSGGNPKIFQVEEENVLVELSRGELFAQCQPVENYYGFGTVAINLATGKLLGVDGTNHQIKKILEQKILAANI